MSLNKVTLIGRVGQDPEIRSTQDGKELAHFSLATTEDWKDKSTGEKKFKTEWHKIVVFGALTSVVKNYVKKGSKLYVEGSLKTRDWTDKDGNKKQVTEIVLQGFNSNLQMLDSKAKSELPKQDSDSLDQLAEGFDDNMDSDIPF